MSDLFWFSDAQMARLEPFFPKLHGKQTVDDRRVLSGITFINRNGLRWRDAPAEYGPPKTLYNRWKRWSDKGIFARMMTGLAAGHGEKRTVMIPSRDIAVQCPAGQRTSVTTQDATASKSCSASSRIGGAWQRDTTGAQRSSCQPSLSPPSSSTGFETQCVQTLVSAKMK